MKKVEFPLVPMIGMVLGVLGIATGFILFLLNMMTFGEENTFKRAVGFMIISFVGGLLLVISMVMGGWSIFNQLLGRFG